MRPILSPYCHPPRPLIMKVETREKYALLIGIRYKGQSDEKGASMELRFPHDDVDRFKEFLVSEYGYKPTNITVMKDSPEVPPHLQPTEKNLVRELSRFIRRDRDNVEYFLLFNGHSDQEEVPDGDDSEEDGLNEYIIPCDDPQAKILDNDLNDWLVKPICAQKHSRLAAVLDTCHSETLLDLYHSRCNRVCRWTSIIRRCARRVREVLAPQALSPPPVLGTLIEVKLARAYCQPHELLDGPIGVFCGSGVCCCRRKNVLARVVCISACKDKEQAWEVDGLQTHCNSMTHNIVDLLTKNKDQSLKQLIRAIDSRLYPPIRGCQHPQVSSDVPLRLERTYLLES